jgi:transporter family protein
MKEWIIPALGTFVCWALSVFIPKVFAEYLSPRSAFVYQGLGAISVSIFVLFSLSFRPDMHPKGVALAVITGVIGNLGMLCFLVAVSRGPVSLIASFTALYPALAILLAKVVLNEPIALRQGLGILLALGAMLLVAT